MGIIHHLTQAVLFLDLVERRSERISSAATALFQVQKNMLDALYSARAQNGPQEMDKN